jgi:large subunit ribosomal protein L28
MSKVCEICGKSTVAGNRIQHKHSVGWRYKAPKSKRTFKPNLRNVEVEVDGKATKLSSCMKCYKKLRNEATALEE